MGKSGRCVRLTLPLSCAVVTKSRNLIFLEPTAPLRACDGTDLREDIRVCTFMTVSSLSLLRIRNISGENRGNINIRFMLNNFV